MAAAKDFLLNQINNGDLLVQSGDFVTGLSDNQHIHDIINDPLGYWKQFPAVGCGIVLYQDSDVNITQLSALIISQLKKDGYKTRIPKITFDNAGNILNIVPNATRS
jgi:hypothetical protein